jgi:peptidoglycan hydrolase-like protein with peptidoglycan-binding domain
MSGFDLRQAQFNRKVRVFHPQALRSPKTTSSGIREKDVRVLQKFFNTHGFIITTSGPGSPGSETSIFGTHTYQALIKFQQSKNLP